MHSQLHFSLPVVVAFLVAFVAQFTRIFSATKPFWGKAPVWVQAWLPPLLPAVTALGAGVSGAQSWTDVAVAFLGAAALLLPGAPSNRTAGAALLCLVMGFGIAVSGCGLFGSGGALAPVAKCAPSPRELLSEVGMVLLQGGDFAATEAALKKLAGEYTESTVDCAVAVLVDDWTNPTAKQDDAHLAGAARGKAHLEAKR